MDEAVPALATGQASTDGVTEQPVNVYIWDMDETLILLKSLLDGSYAGAFDGLKDHEKSTEIGKRWENLILELCDEHFFYEEIENYNEPYLNALNEYDDGRDLTSYDFEADCFSSPYDDANKKKLAYRHRAIGEKYAKGLEKVLDGHMVKVCNDQYSLTDKYTDGWLSSANRIVPPHEGIELGIRDASVIRALAEAYGRKEEHVKKDLKELGDLGLVAKASRSSQKMMFKPKPLTIARVLSTIRTIAKNFKMLEVRTARRPALADISGGGFFIKTVESPGGMLVNGVVKRPARQFLSPSSNKENVPPMGALRATPKRRTPLPDWLFG